MHKFSNFFLMLKQGIKGVFKFRIQFIIILVLTFIATFILSVSFSTQRRMSNSYNNIVKKVDRFSYQGNIQMDSSVNDSSDVFIISNILNNADSVSIQQWVKDDKGNEKILNNKDSYNYVFSNFNDVEGIENYSQEHQNFFTRMIEEQGFKDLFAKNTRYNDWAWNDDASQDGKVKFWNEVYQYSLISFFNALDDLNKNGHKDSYNDPLKYTTIGKYTLAKPGWYEKQVNRKDNKPDGRIESLIDSYDYTPEQRAKNGLSYISPDDLAITNTVVVSMMKISGWMKNATEDYLTNATGVAKATNATLADIYAFLFGKKVSDDNTLYNLANDKDFSWIVGQTDETTSQIIRPYSIDVTNQGDKKYSDGSYLEYGKKQNPNDDKDLANQQMVAAVANHGFRGVLNPTIHTGTTNDYSFDSLSTLDYFKGFSLVWDDETLFNEMSNYNNFHGWYGFGDPFSQIRNGRVSGVQPKEVIYYSYQKMLAIASGFDFGIRREITYFDTSHQVKYRGIVLNEDENYNTTILDGRAPSAVGEIAISEQYARKQKIKPGDVIKAGDGVFTISGLVTDAFSYVPSQDLMNPIPNPKVSTFAYGSEKTLKAMRDGTMTSAGSADGITELYSYFLWNNGSDDTKDNRKEVFLALTADHTSGLKQNFNLVKSFTNNNDLGGNSSSSNIGLTNFDKSNFRYSWTLEPQVFRVYSAVTYTAAGIIALIAIIALVVCVRKTIDLNSKQIGILKALGEGPGQISCSYLSYSIIITFIIIPLAWIAGMVLQIPFVNMFLTYFSAQPYEILWDWTSLVIALFGIGVLSGIVAFGTAYHLTAQPVIKILGVSVKWSDSKILDWIKNTFFKKASFSTRFSLTLTSSGSRQINLMVVVILITSLLMTFGLAIPSVAITANNSYYKSVKYQNSYTQFPLTSNSPHSKNVISYWDGQEYLEDNYVPPEVAKLKLDSSDNYYGYYKDAEDYTSTITSSSVLAPYINGANGVENTYPYILKNNANLLSVIAGMFGNNFYVDTGQSFSLGMIDKFFGVLFQSYDDLRSQANFDKTKGLDEKPNFSDNDKMLQSQVLSTWLTSSIPQVIAAIVNTNSSNQGGDADKNGGNTTWKDDVMNVIYKVIPSYVKGYVQKSESRKDQYAISYQNDIYTPGKETLTTLVDGNSTGINKNLTLTGLDEYQNSIVISDDVKNKAYLPENVKEQIYKVLDNDPQAMTKDIVYNGEMLFNHSTKTLTLPVVPNQQAKSAYEFKKHDNQLTNWTNNVQRIEYQSKNGTIPLPKEAWIYDDTDYVNYASKQDNKYYVNKDSKVYEKAEKGSQEHYFLDPYTLSNNKYTQNVQYDLDANKNLRKNAYLFSDWKEDEKGQITGAYVRPYYTFTNLKMMIPRSQIGDLDSFLYPDGVKSIDGNKTNTWYDENYDAALVPESTKAAYKKIGLSDADINGPWLAINPYDISFYDREIYKKAATASGGELSNLLSGPAYWYRYVTKGAKPPLVMTRNQQNYYNNNVTINLKSVGTIDAYNDKLVVIDSDLANRMLDYSNNRDYHYDYQIFDRKTPGSFVPAGTPARDGTISRFDRYRILDVNDIMNVDGFENNLWQPKSFKLENPQLYAPHAWYNAKLSNYEEAVNFTSQVSFTRTDRWGQFSINLGGSTSGDSSIINGSQLLSESKALIRQVSMLAIAIGMMLIIALIITASLLIMLTGDIYISQYKRFMVLLRALGYSNKQIIGYTFGTVTILSILAWLGGTIVAWVLIFVGVRMIGNAGFALPVGITWWPIVVSFLIMALSYVGSLTVSSHKARTENPSVILTETAE
ncbi:ABC transporter permease [Mesoplasma lactucae]|uniref:ABC3 transporter permease C-terminal domain-containing protein n=1 Tax=Mesoplasma lactucae ATCC 49193 TaxID=81460 RepID=A0A291IRJ5_9MOLU|nr:FtsX-like permease family protein [Mesoplasma lactucae]ATG97346.1 hypothetical protein CP520_01060 [Mesoplasma lactucae ATCC 49193]ATZ20202.1 ABC transporter permease [Mesoplasma lactucae ATCC 49193]MCL8216951.1 hypothetical protein [Mesoplasma lactucae ATCC 49193]